MIEMEVLTPWTKVDDGGVLVNVPLLHTVYRLDSFEDVTHQNGSQIPPTTNWMVLRARIDEASADALRGDVRFHILWEDDAKSASQRRGRIPAAEADRLRSFFDANVKQGAGLDVIGNDDRTGISRTVIASRVKSWAKGLRKDG